MKKHFLLLALFTLLGFFLRIIDVSNDPPGLYIDEASIGYNAYTILTTGKDEYGSTHPLWFRSFGDYKMPVYMYAVASSMALFGKTEFAVRIPSVLTGTFTIPLLFLFLDKLLQLETDKNLRKKMKYMPLLASFLLSISTWHLQFSRGGFEVTMGIFFYLLGCYFYLLFKQKHNVISVFLFIFSFLLAMYTYDTFRILSPVTLIYIAFNEQFYKHKNHFIPSWLLYY